ncbi:MAG: hypothetical protein J0L51_06985 [Rhizobiales bacterium]|nr:hypothetical protein [Hyphomicrobiales bacterium]
MRRKGELSQAEINRQWPHHIALQQLPDHAAQYSRNIEIDAFCVAAGDDAAPRGYSIMHQDAWFEVRCFASAATAAQFIQRFGGRPFDPRAKPRGPGWQGKGDFKLV